VDKLKPDQEIAGKSRKNKKIRHRCLLSAAKGRGAAKKHPGREEVALPGSREVTCYWI
jgi:hypothetical protein